MKIGILGSGDVGRKLSEMKVFPDCIFSEVSIILMER
jgi:hypothetical protein